MRSTFQVTWHHTGIYGVAVKGIPDLVVGRMTIFNWSEEMSFDQIALEEARTRVPRHRLQTYLIRLPKATRCQSARLISVLSGKVRNVFRHPAKRGTHRYI